MAFGVKKNPSSSNLGGHRQGLPEGWPSEGSWLTRLPCHWRTPSQAASVDSLNPIFGPAPHSYSPQYSWDPKLLWAAPSSTPEGELLGLKGWVGAGGEGHPSCSSYRLWVSPYCVSPKPCLPCCSWNSWASPGFWGAIWLPVGPSL